MRPGSTTQQRFLMQSNGGVMPFTAAIDRRPHGPHAVLRPRRRARRRAPISPNDAARTGLVTLDMGGTSADIAFIEGGVPLEVTEGVIARRQIDVPALDMTTISAGGGSIAWIDGGGFLTVGPQSAGADPGPACYGRGGDAADGDRRRYRLRHPQSRLFPRRRPEARRRRRRARRSTTHIADPLGLSVRAAAAGVRRIVDMRMADEVRVFAAKRGVDLSRFTLLPFGGAGAVHAAAVAEELGMAPHPRAAATRRLLGAGPALHRRRPRLHPLGTAPARRCRRPIMPRTFSARSRRRLGRSRRRGNGSLPRRAFSANSICAIPARATNCASPLDGTFDGRLTARSLAAGACAFRRTPCPDPWPCGQGPAGRSGELSPARARRRAEICAARGTAAGRATCRLGRRARASAWSISTAESATPALVYERDGLAVGATIEGPAIVEQFDATTIVPPGWSGRVDDDGEISFWNGGRPEPWMPITIQILRNKIASLVDEMHYHFYRSGYSTIIRESRDFSCVILDRDGRLIVAPPMFFHAPVYRHLVGRILELYRAAGEDGISEGDVFVSNHPYEGGLPHVSDMALRRAGLRRRQDRRLRRIDRAQGRYRRHGRRIDLGQCHRDVPGRPARSADQDPCGRPAAATMSNG